MLSFGTILGHRVERAIVGLYFETVFTLNQLKIICILVSTISVSGPENLLHFIHLIDDFFCYTYLGKYIIIIY